MSKTKIISVHEAWSEVDNVLETNPCDLSHLKSSRAGLNTFNK